MSVEELLPYLSRPSRYLGTEHNVIHKDWHSVEFRAVLAFPDLYEIGMSHHGLQILYHILNRHTNFLAERVYAPDRDLEAMLKEKNEPLFSLESGRDIHDFDMLGITLPYELCYANILTILSCSNIPFYSSERDESCPLIIGGGPCAFHPEPVADFFDAILLGDGEHAITSMAQVIVDAKKERLTRTETLSRLAEISGVYVPSLFTPEYNDSGRFTGIVSHKENCDYVRRAVLPSFESDSFYAKPLVPQSRIVHDRLGIELARGCTRGCRFCQAGMIYRPVRERQPEDVLEIARQGIKNGGFDELALLSLSTGDYSCLAPLLVNLMNYFADQHVSVSMPSMRVGTLTPEIMEQVKRVRKSGFTIAPEAGSDRLRRIINKGITEDDLLETVRTASSLGWKTIKLYFMIGLPYETDDDVDAIADLVQKAKRAAGKNININVSVGAFVPKPHTPFQWSSQLGVKESFRKFDTIKYRLPKGARLKWNDPRLSYLEGVFSRGDRQLSKVIEKAWLLGARLDGWSEHFDLSIWQKAATELSINLDHYLEEQSIDNPLPWQHLSAGVDESFYKKELENAQKQKYTPDCRNHGCQKCGLCDFKTIKPVTYPEDSFIVQAARTSTGNNLTGKPANHKTYHYWFNYQRLGKARFLGHLELLQVIFRALRRAELSVRFSQGFNPSPKVSFSPALPVGTESHAEYFAAEFERPIDNLQSAMDLLNDEMPQGVAINKIWLGSKSMPSKVETDYQIQSSVQLDQRKIDSYLASKEYCVEVFRKKRRRMIDVRNQIPSLALVDQFTLNMTMITEISLAGVKPLEFVKDLFGLSDKDVSESSLVKLRYKVL